MTPPQGRTMSSNGNIQCYFKCIFFSFLSDTGFYLFRLKWLLSEPACRYTFMLNMNAWVNTWHSFFQKGRRVIYNSKDEKLYIHISLSFTGTLIYMHFSEISPLCILVTHFQRGSRPKGWTDPKGTRKFVFAFSFFFLQNFALPHFLEVAVPLTHSQGPSQSPFVNRTMFYNSPFFLRWPYQ